MRQVWCRDEYASYEHEVTEGSGERIVGESQTRVLRGGSILSGAQSVRSSVRHSSDPQAAHIAYGVRPLRALER